MNAVSKGVISGRLLMGVHGLFQAFFVDRHLNRHVRQGRVDDFIGQRLHRGVICRVLMELSNRPNAVEKKTKHVSANNVLTQLTNTRRWQ